MHQTQSIKQNVLFERQPISLPKLLLFPLEVALVAPFALGDTWF